MLPTSPKERKEMPITRGVLDYFPDAIAEVAKVSKKGNDQHNPGEEMHWAREKSTDQADCIARHLIERGGIDTDGMRHSAKLVWRALALLQLELEAESHKEHDKEFLNTEYPQYLWASTYEYHCTKGGYCTRSRNTDEGCKKCGYNYEGRKVRDVDGEHDLEYVGSGLWGCTKCHRMTVEPYDFKGWDCA